MGKIVYTDTTTYRNCKENLQMAIKECKQAIHIYKTIDANEPMLVVYRKKLEAQQHRWFAEGIFHMLNAVHFEHKDIMTLRDLLIEAEYLRVQNAAIQGEEI